MNWFIYNDIDSRKFKNLLVNELPSIIKPSEKVTTYDIDCMHGNLTEMTGKFDNVSKTVTCTLKSNESIDAIVNWLRGSGVVIFSNQPNRYYKAKIINSISLDRVIRQFRTFIIQFECYPLGYLLNENEVVIEKDQSTIFNPGTHESEPEITVYCQGDGVLNINGIKITLTDIDEYIKINSQVCQCTKDGVGCGKKMKGKYPTLPPGLTSISFSGNVTKVHVKINPVMV